MLQRYEAGNVIQPLLHFDDLCFVHCLDGRETPRTYWATDVVAINLHLRQLLFVYFNVF
jgi:hypothetical protein